MSIKELCERWGAGQDIIETAKHCESVSDLLAKCHGASAVWIATRPGVMSEEGSQRLREAVMSIGPSCYAMDRLRLGNDDAWKTAYYTVAAFGSVAAADAERTGIRHDSVESYAISDEAMRQAWFRLGAIAKGIMQEASR